MPHCRGHRCEAKVRHRHGNRSPYPGPPAPQPAGRQSLRARRRRRHRRAGAADGAAAGRARRRRHGDRPQRGHVSAGGSGGGAGAAAAAGASRQPALALSRPLRHRALGAAAAAAAQPRRLVPAPIPQRGRRLDPMGDQRDLAQHRRHRARPRPDHGALCLGAGGGLRHRPAHHQRRGHRRLAAFSAGGARHCAWRRADLLRRRSGAGHAGPKPGLASCRAARPAAGDGLRARRRADGFRAFRLPAHLWPEAWAERRRRRADPQPLHRRQCAAADSRSAGSPTI